MAAPTANIIVDKGADFTTSIAIKNNNGSAFNLTGCSLQSYIKKHEGATTKVDFSVGITSTIGGEITLALTDTQTTTMKSGRYFYDVVIIESTGNRVRAAQGQVFVSPGITT